MSTGTTTRVEQATRLLLQGHPASSTPKVINCSRGGTVNSPEPSQGTAPMPSPDCNLTFMAHIEELLCLVSRACYEDIEAPPEQSLGLVKQPGPC